MDTKDFLKETSIVGLDKIAENQKTGLMEHVSNQKSEPTKTKIFKTACRACSGKCGVLVHVQNGRVVKLEGDPDNPMSKGTLCAKGLSGIQALYHPNRMKYPLLRVGERGENKWKRISWDEAIELIYQKLTEVRREYGAESLICSTGGGGNPEFWGPARFCNLFGSPNWFEPGSTQCYMPRMMSYALMHDRKSVRATTSITDGECSEIYFADSPIKSLVMWGTAPSYSSPSMGGRAVNELRERGVKTVVIDPRLTADAAKADIWLPIRPGTDVALMLAWIRYILQYKLYDEEIVMKWSNLPFLVNPKTKMCLRESDIKLDGDPDTYVVWDRKSKSAQPLPYPWDDNLDPALEGEYMVDGLLCKTGFQLLKERAEPFTLEKAGAICWLEPLMIEKAVKMYAENTPSGLSLGVATDHTANATAAAMGAATLDLILGNVQKPGALLQKFTTPMVRESIMSGLHRFLPEEQLRKRLGGIEFKGMLTWQVAHNPSILDAIKTGKPYKPRVWIERSGNKLVNMANATEWADAMKELDFIVHMFLYPTSFSAYSDLLLPATEWLETDGIFNVLNKSVIRQAVTHTWETLNEANLWIRLAKRFAEDGDTAFQNAFDPEKTFPEQAYEETQKKMVDTNCETGLGITFEEFAEKSPVEICSMEDYRQYYQYKKIDATTGKPYGFSTPSKKVEIYGEAFVTLGRTGTPYATYPLPPASKDYEPLPNYIEPSESPLEENDLAKRFPLVMTGGRLPINHHSTLRNVPWLRELSPVAEIWIHPKAASEYGISHGDWVWVESLRGKTQAKAFVTTGINPGTVYMERFWNPETLNSKTHGWREMNVNILSKSDPPYDDVCGTTVLRGFLVSVTKADGPPKGIWTKPEDFSSWLPNPSDQEQEVKK